MNSTIIFHLLIDLIAIGVLIYIFRSNKKFFVVALLILLLIIFLIPEFLLPYELWEYLLKD